jgi:shikimate kinase/3-dehydroquinate synthase
MSDRNLVLTGFMGVGKSAVGRRVAARLGRKFVDTDELIEARAGRAVPEIFAREGEAHFRALEAEVCRELSCAQGLVIATGGWTLGSPQNRAAIEAGGLVVCLTADVPTLIQRLERTEAYRPMLQGGDGRQEAPSDRESRVKALLAARKLTYHSFPLQVNTARWSIQEAADRILALWEAFAASDLPFALPVAAPGGDYTILIGEELLDRLGLLLAGLDHWTAAALVSDDVVGPLHADRAAAGLERGWGIGRTSPAAIARCVMPAGEAHKTLTTVESLYGQFLAAGLDRGSLIVALGGGVVGDVAGFAAATYMRGLPLVQVPTTLLSMVDSSVGGKTGVDLPAGKNLVGAFKQPALVVIDPTLLVSLPAADFRAGLGEVVKAAVIGDPLLFERMETGQLDLAWLIRRAVAVKVAVVEEDPFEQGRRAVLNLGHTFGHAFEVLSDYRLRHGEAIAMGTVVAARLAVELGRCPADVAHRIVALLGHLSLPTAAPDYDPEAVWTAMTADKKKQGSRLRFVLPLDIGRVEVFDDVPREAVLAALESLAVN